MRRRSGVFMRTGRVSAQPFWRKGPESEQIGEFDRVVENAEHLASALLPVHMASAAVHLTALGPVIKPILAVGDAVGIDAFRSLRTARLYGGAPGEPEGAECEN